MHRRDALRLRTIVLGAALILAFVGSATYDGWRLHQQITAANERELGNLAKALGAEAARSLEAVDVLLRETADWYEGADAPRRPAAIANGLATRAAGVAQVSVLSIVGADGQQLARSRETGEPMANVADRPYFQRQREQAQEGLFINEPIVTRTERIPALVLSRRLDGPDGGFDGVVTAIVTLQQLQTAYTALDLGERSSLVLTLADGTLVARQPPAAALEGRVKYPELVALKGGELIDRSTSPVDGRTKLVASVGVGQQPLVLAITRDEEQALLPWVDEMRSAVVRTVLLSLLVLATIAGLLRQMRRLERGEAALRASEERYAMVMEAASEGHIEWHLADGAVFPSERWAALHGVDPSVRLAHADALVRHVAVHPEDAEAVRQGIRDHLEGRTPAIEMDYRVQAQDGSWRWIHARGRRVLDGAGQPVRVFSSAIDISERRRAAEERTRLDARLQQTQKLEALGTLAGGIAHDFNNILGAILGFGEMAQQRAEAGSAIRRHVDQVMQSGARARLLVRRILDFSRNGVAERVPVNLQCVVEEVVAMLSPSLPATFHVQTQLTSGSSAVIGDPTQLYQVAMNLCTNAVQAMGDAGTVELSLTRVELAEGRALLHGQLQPGPHLCLAVGDTGPGIAPEVLARMFDPFFTTKKVGEGTGLGLSVVHGIVSDLGGAIDVCGRAPHGTLVSVWLPVCGETEAPMPAGQADWPAGAGQTIMVVDDERALLELAEELLAGLGYEPVGYPTAEAALAAFEAAPQRFDAVVTDLALPGLQGDALAERLLALRPGLPVLLVSGNLGAATEQQALAGGVRAVLHKPLAGRDLAEGLARALEGR
ncbi:ATP-binding protein [Pseudorhodoferax soli]|uniref:histidine kinase n=1 Tax=Pseudorhodoferax soli TaxID=545864 RepID=A0A368XXJ6_9BURK|nr:ATP-binding protein [Pseudorhodoferax soli]RCW71257.1 PAS domain S-box-containing protein [Pseudorhodoferax soli]